jgi:CRP-like cAMP-binding protein
MYLIGVIVSTVSSLACGFAPTSGALVAFRFAQGAGAAVMVPQIMSVIRMHFVGPARARALSAYGAVLSAGAVAGQIVGGPTPPWSSPKAASSWLARPSFPPAGSSEPPGSSPNGTGDGTSRPTRTALPTEPARRRPPPVPILRPLIKEKCERHACQSSDYRTAAVVEMSGTWVASSTLAQEVRPMPDAYAQLGAFLRGWCEFPDAELAKVRQVFRPVTAPRGVLLTMAGEHPDRVAFIAAGLVRLFYTAADGTERAHGFRAENQLVCAYSAVLRGEPAHMSIETVQPCELLVASRVAFDELRAGHWCWRELIARLTEQLYLQQEARQRELLLDDAATRYLSFITGQPGLAGRLTQALIASYVGVTPVALSRIRARLISVNDKAVARS